jgi:hypothetical protein
MDDDPQQQRQAPTSNDYAIAKALSELEEQNYSQYTPKKRRRGQPFRCIICLEDDLESFKGYTLSNCHHRFCISCLTSLVKSSTPTTSITPSMGITCPQVNCSNTLSLGDIQYIFRNDPSAWNQYSETASMAFLERQVAAAEGGDMRRCPTGRCNYIFIHDEAGHRHFDCPLCHASFCLQCDANEGRVGPAHVGLSCAERREQLRQEAEERRKMEEWKVQNTQADARFQELMTKEGSQGITRPCPKCKQLITKNGGCNHMTCVCGHNYNWS